MCVCVCILYISVVRVYRVKHMCGKADLVRFTLQMRLFEKHLSQNTSSVYYLQTFGLHMIFRKIKLILTT